MTGMLIIEWTTRLVLLLLIGLSVWSVSIMIERRRYFRTAAQKSQGLSGELKELVKKGQKEALVAWIQRHPGTEATLIQAAIDAMDGGPECSERAVQSFLGEKRAELEKGFTVLATLGANAPFIGLFGTVLGIIQAFGTLSSQQGSAQSVMSNISEALIATAIGLFVAIPAVVAYNAFSKQARSILAECTAIKDLFLSRFPVIQGGKR